MKSHTVQREPVHNLAEQQKPITPTYTSTHTSTHTSTPAHTQTHTQAHAHQPTQTPPCTRSEQHRYIGEKLITITIDHKFGKAKLTVRGHITDLTSALDKGSPCCSSARTRSHAHLNALIAAILKAISLESTACAAPSVSTTWTPCAGVYVAAAAAATTHAQIPATSIICCRVSRKLDISHWQVLTLHINGSAAARPPALQKLAATIRSFAAQNSLAVKPQRRM